MQRTISAFLAACLIGVGANPCCGQAQSKTVNVTFQALLARVAQRDKPSGAILKIKPTKDETTDASTLNFSMEKLPDVSEVVITITGDAKPGEPTAIFEQYHLKADDAIQQELKNRAALEIHQDYKLGAVRLKVKYLMRPGVLCTPTCAAMALDYYGDSRDPRDLKALATPPNSSYEGTYFKDMTSGVEKIGYLWLNEGYDVNEDGYQQGLQDILSSLRQHRPVIVDVVLKGESTVLLLVGFDEIAGQLFYFNPTGSSPASGKLTAQEFQEDWHSVVANTRGAIFTRPKDQK